MESSGSCATGTQDFAAPIFCDYLSDISTDSDEGSDDIIDESARDSTAHLNESPVVTSCNSTDISESLSHLPSVHPLKRQKLAVPFCAQCEIDATARLEAWENALVEIEKLLKSTKTEFAGGPHGLQAKWAWSIQSHLSLMIWKGRNTINASEMAAECHGFAAVWGGCQIWSWTRTWTSHHKLPVSLTGCHAKAYSLLDDPGIAAELRAYVRSNKWAVDAQKLTDFSKEKLIPAEVEKYLQGAVQDEMPQGVKHYMNLKLFPRCHAPNTFGTVNMEHTIDSSLSWSER